MTRVFTFLFKGKRAIVTAPIFLALLAAPYFGGRWLWYHGRSSGTRSGIIRKVSVKGPPYCKYAAAELVVQGGTSAQQIGVGGDVWEFTLDSPDVNSALYKQLEQSERDGKRVTVHYRQDEGNHDKPWLLCAKPDYYAERIE